MPEPLLLLACASVLSVAFIALTRRRPGDATYRHALGIALVAAYLLLYVNVDVGIIGTERNNANLMYGGVLAVGVIGAAIGRFQPPAMARALAATALAQVIVAVIALIGGLGVSGPVWPMDLLMLTAMFAAAWLWSARLFRDAARRRPPVSAGQQG